MNDIKAIVAFLVVLHVKRHLTKAAPEHSMFLRKFWAGTKKYIVQGQYWEFVLIFKELEKNATILFV